MPAFRANRKMQPRGVWRPVAAMLALFVSGCMSNPDDQIPDLDGYRERLLAIERHDLPQTTWILDRHGAMLAEIVPEGGYRTWVRLSEIPLALQQAVVATEDRTFYENPGIDQRAVARAALQNSTTGDTVSGASTITMQLVRLVAFDTRERFEMSMERKLREVYLAAEVDEAYSKDEILEAYLNAAYFGNRAQGVEAAARRYFDKSASALSVAESTLLAGLVQSPSALDPRLNPKGARERQRTVLDSMVAAGFLSRTAAEVVWMTPLAVIDPPPGPERRSRFFVDYIEQRALPEILGPELAARGGFTVTTSLDADFDATLTQIAAGHVASLRAPHNLNAAAVVALRPGSGEVLAMVGGIDYDDPSDGQVNMVTSPRQLGSTFKPIAYGTFIEKGGSPASLLWDVPYRFQWGNEVYEPVNYDGVYRGPVRLREALANSINAAAIDVAAQLGVATLHAKAIDMGLPLDPRASQYGLSLALGGGAVPLLDMVGAYGALAAGGLHTAPASVLQIVDSATGETRYTHVPSPRRVLDARAAWLITDILSDAEARRPAFGDAPSLRLSRTAAVKTGTSNDFRDNTTIGYTPYLAIGVWTGNKNSQPMRNVLGITGAAPIWKASMEAAFAEPRIMRILASGAEQPPDGFPQPTGIEPIEICKLASLTLSGRCQRIQEWVSRDSRAAGGDKAFGFYRLGSQTGGAPSGCAIPATQGEAGAQAYLQLARPPEMSKTIRDWSRRNGVSVAPEPCSVAQQ